MRLRNEAKVGLIVFIGIVALVFVYWFLGGLTVRASSYSIFGYFPNVQKLDKGAQVRMAGVQIGLVRETKLVGTKARVEMLIDNGVCIPRDSVARVTAGGFIGENFIEITPGERRACLKSGNVIRTAQVVQPEDLMEQANGLIKDLRVSAASINQILGNKELVASLKDTIRQLNTATKAAAQLATSAQGLIGGISPQVSDILNNLQNTTAVATRTSSEIQAMIAEDVRPNVRTLMQQASGVAQNLNAAVTEARNLLAAVGGNTGNLRETLTKVNQALANVDAATCQAAEMMANLNQASTGIRDIATDKELQENLKATVRNAAQASAQATELLENINRRLGRRATKPSTPPVPRGAVPEQGIAANALWNTAEGDYRFDAYYTYFGAPHSIYRLGAYDIGEDTRAIVQGGRLLSPGSVLRYGIYASRLGIGYDRRVGGRGFVSADLFRPNEPELELRGVLGIRGPWGLYAGVRDVFHEDDRDVLVGVRYQE